MTKLTQQEIEQERVKFEEYFFSIYQEKISQEWMGECFCYMSDGIQERFKFWIARAELDKAGKKLNY